MKKHTGGCVVVVDVDVEVDVVAAVVVVSSLVVVIFIVVISGVVVREVAGSVVLFAIDASAAVEIGVVAT
jgi:hypothetical protein